MESFIKEIITPDQEVNFWLIKHIGCNYKEFFYKKDMKDILDKILSGDLKVGIYDIYGLEPASFHNGSVAIMPDINAIEICNILDKPKYYLVAINMYTNQKIYTDIPILNNKEKDDFLELEALKKFIYSNVDSSAVNANDVPSTIAILKENLDRLLVSYSNKCKYIIDTIRDILVRPLDIKKLEPLYILGILYDNKDIALYDIDGFLMKNGTTYISLEILYKNRTKDFIQMPIADYFNIFDENTKICDGSMYLAIVDKYNIKIGDASNIYFTDLECKRKTTILDWNEIK